jgi:hypothetical protein
MRSRTNFETSRKKILEDITFATSTSTSSRTRQMPIRFAFSRKHHGVSCHQPLSLKLTQHVCGYGSTNKPVCSTTNLWQPINSTLGLQFNTTVCSTTKLWQPTTQLQDSPHEPADSNPRTIPTLCRSPKLLSQEPYSAYTYNSCA